MGEALSNNDFTTRPHVCICIVSLVFYRNVEMISCDDNLDPVAAGHSLDELVGALKDAGVNKAGLIVGVDFTRSNEW